MLSRSLCSAEPGPLANSSPRGPGPPARPSQRDSWCGPRTLCTPTSPSHRPACLPLTQAIPLPTRAFSQTPTVSLVTTHSTGECNCCSDYLQPLQ